MATQSFLFPIVPPRTGLSIRLYYDDQTLLLYRFDANRSRHGRQEASPTTSVASRHTNLHARLRGPLLDADRPPVPLELDGTRHGGKRRPRSHQAHPRSRRCSKLVFPGFSRARAGRRPRRLWARIPAPHDF
ncbi:MAG: hypothetical protein ACLQCU_09255 [Acidimicrobiales bacterium]